MGGWAVGGPLLLAAPYRTVLCFVVPANTKPHPACPNPEAPTRAQPQAPAALFAASDGLLPVQQPLVRRLSPVACRPSPVARCERTYDM